ncbi:MAG TPA: galactokinase [Actinomycetota bacterium]|nr:galactokinase [Actinomycetota bacterium]
MTSELGHDPLGDQVVHVRNAFRERAGSAPDGIWVAPGRVNLIGDHTDHNDGFVLPLAIERYVVAAVARREDGPVRAWSLQERAPAVFEVAKIGRNEPGGWAAYVAGVAWAIGQGGTAIGGFDLVLDGAVRPGAGLASSAAVECATALALADLFAIGLSRQELARAARRAEVEIVGVPCGVMDQMALMCCQEGSAMFLDTRSLEMEHLPLALDDLTLLVVDVGTPHRLVEGWYARRLAECGAAARELGVAALRDATPADLDRLVDETIGRRARHVVTENRRVLDVVSLLRRDAIAEVGPMLTASHVSLRDDFEVSTPELDAVVEVCIRGGALGARMTGAGFGGCVIALVPNDALSEVRRRVSDEAIAGDRGSPRSFAVTPAQGARRVA